MHRSLCFHCGIYLACVRVKFLAELAYSLFSLYISEGERLHPVERLCPAGALMDSSSVGILPVVSPQRFLIGAVRYGLLTLALTSSYTINGKKSSVLENFVLTGSVRAKIEFTESVSARSIYLLFCD